MFHPRKTIYSLLLAAILFPSLVCAQGVQYTRKEAGDGGTAVPYPLVTVCTSGAAYTPLPCTPKASIYSDAALSVPLANPFRGDMFGNIEFYATPAAYVVSVTAPYSPGYSFKMSASGGFAGTISSTLVAFGTALNTIGSDGNFIWDVTVADPPRKQLTMIGSQGVLRPYNYTSALNSTWSIDFAGHQADAATATFGAIQQKVISNTNGAVTGQFDFFVENAGTPNDVLTLVKTGALTPLSLNGTCVISATQTLQACINLFPSGNGDIFIPLGTWSSAAAITISGNAQSSIRITGAGRNSIIKYTGGGAIAAVLDIGTSTPTVQLLSSIILRDFTIEGNANSTHALRMQGVQTSTVENIDGRDVAGSALQWLFGTGNRINSWITSATDGIGSFTITPTGCLELGELGSTTFGFTTTTIDAPRCESVSGTAVKMTNAQANSMSAAQISTVGTALDIEPGAGAISSLQNSFTSSLFENSSNADGVIVNGLQTHFYDSQIATLGTGKLHIKASNNFIEGGQVGTPGITIDTGVLNTHIKQVSMLPANLTDNGSSTMLTNNWDPTTSKPWQLTVPTYRQVIPASGVVVDLPTSDPQDHSVQGCWKFIGTAATVISSTPLTTAKPWRAVLHGVWQNDTDGAGLAQLAEIQEVTSVANTLVIGTITVTFTVNGSGKFQGVNSASNTMFCGTITINPNPNGAAGTSALSLKGDVTTARNVRAIQSISDQGAACTNGELALSANWGNTGAPTVTAVAGTGQTCQWTITAGGAATGASPTITDTLTNALPAATIVCDMRMVGGTGTATLINQTSLSATAPIFTFGGTPGVGLTYIVVRRCGP